MCIRDRYKPENLKTIITAFINKYQDFNNKTRFNLVLNQYERNYLDWVQFNRGINRTKIIKSSLNEVIEKDLAYKKYLETN